MPTRIVPIVLCAVVLAAGALDSHAQAPNQPGVDVGPGTALKLPPPFATQAATNPSRVIGWPPGRKPSAPPGFEVSLLAENLKEPRWIYVLPNGDILVACSVAGQIELLRGVGSDGRAATQTVFLSGQNRPFGMLLLGDHLYVGNTNAVLRFPYKAGETQITAAGEKILDLPGGGHYTRNLIANPSGTKIYVSVGSSSNVDENGADAKDPRRAAILEMNPDGSGMRVFASGLRNPVGMSWEPVTRTLWTAVNERDNLGDQLPPDYITSVKDGAFYGWPYSYFGQHEDPRKKGQRPDLVAKAVVPDYATGAHTASLGLTFYTGTRFPAKYRGGAFIGQHGSWNRSQHVGYKVAFLAFRNGKPSGTMEDFLTGFVSSGTEVYGRPVGVTVAPDGSLLVADDAGGKIWRVSYTGK